MTLLQIVILAIVQAVTEFLPISSSGHLILVPFFLGWRDQGLTFDVATHAGTLLAVVVYFRRDLRDLIAGLFTGSSSSNDGEYSPRSLAWSIALGTVPAGIAGLAFKDVIEREARNPLLIASTAVFYGLLLFLADRIGRKSREIGELGWRDALWIGVAQALALVPGTSRSGVTMTAALLLGFTRPSSARFSFLLSVPITAVAAALKAAELAAAGVTAQQLFPLVLGAVVAAGAGYAVIAWLLAWLRRRSLTVFVVYRLLLAAVIVATLVLR
jgi:undecaprenyl-diphosphatase